MWLSRNMNTPNSPLILQDVNGDLIFLALIESPLRWAHLLQMIAHQGSVEIHILFSDHKCHRAQNVILWSKSKTYLIGRMDQTALFVHWQHILYVVCDLFSWSLLRTFQSTQLNHQQNKFRLIIIQWRILF